MKAFAQQFLDKGMTAQVHTYRFQGHSPADPEHERGRKVPQPVL